MAWVAPSKDIGEAGPIVLDSAARHRLAGCRLHRHIPMSESDPNAAAPAAESAGKSGSKTRRISNPRPKKARTEAASGSGTESAGVTVEAPKRPKFPEFPPTPEPVVRTVVESAAAPGSGASAVTEPAGGSDWPEPEPASSGAASGGGEGSKRKRRRKKGKGGIQSQRGESQETPAAGQPAEDSAEEAGAANASRQSQQQSQPQAARFRIDPEQLAKFAWKIYLGEVGEEGIALIGDQDAKELSRRCFRLAEIFLEEQARRR
jgi:hypothetical protein